MNNIAQIKYSIQNVGIIAGFNGDWFFYVKIFFDQTKIQTILIRNAGDTKWTLPFPPLLKCVCVFPYSMACAVPCLHVLIPVFLIQTSNPHQTCYCTMIIHLMSLMVILHTSIQKNTKRRLNRAETIKPPTSDHHYNNYKYFSLSLQKIVRELVKSVLEDRDVMPETEKENTAVSSELLEGNWILYWLFPILFQVY